MDRDFEVGGRKFKLNKINALDQFQVVRRITPVLGELLPVLGKLSKLPKEKFDEPEFATEYLGEFSPVLSAFSKLSDEDSNRILMSLLASIEMQQPGLNTWAFVARNGILMIQDMELPMMLQLAGRAFMYNLSGFFAVAPQVSHGGK